MQFLVLAFAALAAASPAIKLRAPIQVCPALDTPQCCQADVDGVLALTCESRMFQPGYFLGLRSNLCQPPHHQRTFTSSRRSAQILA